MISTRWLANPNWVRSHFPHNDHIDSTPPLPNFVDSWARLVANFFYTHFFLVSVRRSTPNHTSLKYRCVMKISNRIGPANLTWNSLAPQYWQCVLSERPSSCRLCKGGAKYSFFSDCTLCPGEFGRHRKHCHDIARCGFPSWVRDFCCKMTSILERFNVKNSKILKVKNCCSTMSSVIRNA